MGLVRYGATLGSSADFLGDSEMPNWSVMNGEKPMVWSHMLATAYVHMGGLLMARVIAKCDSWDDPNDWEVMVTVTKMELMLV